MTRGYVTAGEAGLIVYLGGIAVFVIVLLIGASKQADDHGGKNADDMIDRESDMCAIRVTAPCGDNDICRYTTRVPCAELDALVKASKGGK